MTAPINLNKTRKAKAKAAKQTKASENRVKFGQSKTEKASAKLRAEKQQREFDGKRRDK